MGSQETLKDRVENGEILPLGSRIVDAGGIIYAGKIESIDTNGTILVKDGNSEHLITKNAYDAWAILEDD